MSIITIARECGAGGGAIAKELSLRLSALQINKNVLEERLSSYGIDGGWLDKFDEKKPGLLSVFSNSQEVYLLLMKLALLSVVSEAENSVVLGRGAHLLLKDVKNCLRIRLVAPFENRCSRIMAETGMSTKEVEQFIRSTDRQRAGFCNFHYESDWTDPMAYDFVINTENFSDSEICELVISEVESRNTLENRKAGAAMLARLLLAQKIRKLILLDNRFPLPVFDVSVGEGGHVVLTGATMSGMVPAQVFDVVKNLEGVSSVENNIHVSVEMPRIFGH